MTAAPTAIPRKIQALPLAAPSLSPLVARSTSAQAVPSGYGSSSCAVTISSRRSGIIADRPRRPPRNASATTCMYGGTMPQRKSAGIVKMVPVASAVEAEATVCERLASRIVAFERRSRKAATVITAAGIDAETVIPTRSPRYAFAAPNTMPSTTPVATAFRVNSAVLSGRDMRGIMARPAPPAQRSPAVSPTGSRTRRSCGSPDASAG